MTGGFSTPKKDKAIKVSSGRLVKTGHILARGKDSYRAGVNVKGLGTLYALCPGKIYFSKKKTSHGKARTYINILPLEKKEAK
ncbi:MAG: 50S ribosomal protein L27 [Candidatus Omnitrophica bacterium]|nr:50S ribosomal protein L27 [Candidatus Omnitrophota bacterium]